MHVLRHIDRDQFHMDFLVHGPETYDFEEEATQLGAKIIRCRPWHYVPKFQRILHEHGPYDAVHSHVHTFSGLPLLLAHRAGVPVRIVHSHCDVPSIDIKPGLPRRAYLHQMRKWIDAHSTQALAVSQVARQSLFPNGPSVQILPPSIDLAPFRSPSIQHPAIPHDALVIGHAGRFTSHKNHEFLVRIAAEIYRAEPRAWFLFAGDGPLFEKIRSRFPQRATFTGVCAHVPALMLGSMYVFVFPSSSEGLGLAVVEAQAAGLPCVISDRVPFETDVVPALVHRLSLSDPPERWAAKILALFKAPPAVTQAAALAEVERSTFGGLHSVHELARIYSLASTTRYRPSLI